MKFAIKSKANSRFLPVRVFGASVRGPMHTRSAQPCEDAWKGSEMHQAAAISVSDGMGSKPAAARGARAAVTAAIRAARTWGTAHTAEPDWICRLIEAQWRFAVEPEQPRNCAATCHMIAAHAQGGIVYVGLGDGMALLQSGKKPVQRLYSRPPSDFVNESLGLGVNHRIADWAHARLPLPKAPWIAVLVTDGIADDLRPEKLEVFLKWLRDDIGRRPPAARLTALRKALREWPTPGHLDDKTVAVLLSH